jgi:hypothetical protein
LKRKDDRACNDDGRRHLYDQECAAWSVDERDPNARSDRVHAASHSAEPAVHFGMWVIPSLQQHKGR